MKVRAAVCGQDDALGRHSRRRDHQIVRPSFGSAAMDMRQQPSVDFGRRQVVGLDRQRLREP